DLHLKLTPYPLLRIREPTISLPRGVDARAQRLTVGIGVLPLLTGRLRLLELSLESPRATVSLADSTPAASAAADARSDDRPLPAVKFPRLIEQLKKVAGKAAIHIRDGRLKLLDGEKVLDTWRQVGLTYTGETRVMKLKAAATSTALGDVRADLLIEPVSMDVDGQIDVGDIALPRVMAKIWPSLPIRVSEGSLRLGIHLNLQRRSGSEVRVSAASPLLSIQRNHRTIRLEGVEVDMGFQRLEGEVKVELASLKTAKPSLAISGTARRPEGAGWNLEVAAQPFDIAPVRTLARAWAGDLAAVNILFDILRSGRVLSISARSSARTLKGLAALKRIVVDAQVDRTGIRIPKTHLDVEDLSGRINLDRGALALQIDSAHLVGTQLADGRFRIELAEASLPLAANIGVQTDLAKLPEILSKVDGTEMQQALTAQIETLSGRADGRFDIKGPVADLNWAVQVNDLEGRLTSPRLPMPVAIETASGRYADRGLTVNHLSGRVGSSTVERFSGRLSFGKAPILRSGSARLRLVLGEWFEWAKTWEAARKVLRPIRSLSGRLAISDLKFSGPLTDPLRGDYDLRGRLQTLRATTDRLPGALAISGGTFEAASARIQVTGLKATLSDTSLTATGTLSRPFSEDASLKLSADGIIGPKIANWALTQWGGGDRVAVEHPIALSRLSVVSDLRGTHAIDTAVQPVDGPTLTAELRLAPDKISVPALTVTDVYSDARLSFEQQAGQSSARFNGRLDVRSLNLFLKGKAPRTGWIAGDWRATLAGSDWQDTRMTGRLQGGNIALGLPIGDNADGPLLERFAITATGSQVAIQSADVQWEEMGLALDGWLGRSDTGLSFDLRAKSPYIDGDKVLARFGQHEGGAPTPADTPAPTKNANWRSDLRGDLHIDIDHLKYGAHHIRRLAAKIHVAEGQILVEVPEADLCDITLAGSLTMGQQDMRLQLAPTSAARNVGQALACLFQKPIEADGRLYLVGDIAATGSAKESPANLMKRLTGPVRMTATEGRIYQANLLAKILAVVNVTEIFAGQYPGFSEKGMAYKKFALDGHFKNGVFAIDTCSLDSPTLQMTCKGRVDLPDDKIDITVLAAPLKTVDRIIKHLPAIGYVLGGTLISIPVRVHGPLGDPSVVPLSPSAVGEGVLEMMKRTFQLPVKLFTPQSAQP
ncbi:MAG: AsmA-like C-terminal domain-containing protein, partial [Desulfosarcinaceae bacterium]